MAKSSIKDMTQGNPAKLILGFALPMLLGYLFQQFYSMVDTIIVGKWLGVTSLAAVGTTGSVYFMIIGFCIGACSGFSIPMAQCFGAGDYHFLRKYTANSVWASIAFAVIMTVAVCLLCMNILEWMRTPEDIIGESYQYIFIIFLGIPVTYLYNLLASMIRALGDSRTPVYFLLLSSGINIVLDIVSIRVLGMGVEGPAWATVISQGISGLFCLVFMIKKFEILHIKREEWAYDGQCMKILCAMGIPMGLQYSITAIGGVVLQAAVNGLGSLAVAAMTAGSKISIFFSCPFDALGGTMATYAGQNVGAKKLDRIRQGMKSAIIMGSIYGIAAFGVLTLFGKQIALLFVDAEEVQIIGQVHLFLIIISAFYILLAIVNIVRFCIQGMGFSKLAILAGACEMIGRGVIGFGFVPLFGFTAACFASPVAWVLADAFLIPAYCICMKKTRILFGEERGNRYGYE